MVDLWPNASYFNRHSVQFIYLFVSSLPLGQQVCVLVWSLHSDMSWKTAGVCCIRHKFWWHRHACTNIRGYVVWERVVCVWWGWGELVLTLICSSYYAAYMFCILYEYVFVRACIVCVATYILCQFCIKLFYDSMCWKLALFHNYIMIIPCQYLVEVSEIPETCASFYNTYLLIHVPESIIICSCYSACL